MTGVLLFSLSWYIALLTQDLRILFNDKLTFSFLLQGKSCAPIHLYRKNDEKSFFQWIIKTNG